MRKLIVALTTYSLLSTVAFAQDGYVFKLQLTTPNAHHDPDGVWSDQDLDNVRDIGKDLNIVPQIYTARLKTPSGEWLLSQLSGLCNPQGMCDAVLVKLAPGKGREIMANPLITKGGSATLSLNYKKLTTNEINESGHGFIGSYDVEQIK